MKQAILFITILILALFMHSLVLWKTKPHEMGFKVVPFSDLPGWSTANTEKSLKAFQISCKAFLKQEPTISVGSRFIELQAKDWQPVCKEALSIHAASNKVAKTFFQTWFTPVEFFDEKPVRGLFTGYYMPLLYGSLTKTKKYNVPIYALPDNLISVNLGLFDPSLAHRRIIGRVSGKHFVPYYTRKEINKGAIAHDAAVIAWIDNSVDRTFLEIQGSGIIKLTDGNQLVVNYSGENGAPYTSIARVLIDEGVMTKDNASMQRIRAYLGAHPDKLDWVLNKNQSFVFFEKLQQPLALGSQGVALTPGYSMAIDRKWVPMGAPIWLNTTKPHPKLAKELPFRRLMIAQDTGGAIRGAVRGDVYWGAGERATAMAGRMKNPGHYWLLLPKHTLSRLQSMLIQ